MKKSKKKIKVRDMKPKKNPRAGGLHNQKAAQGQKFMQGAGRHALN
jgi:hypothetical protein